MKKWVCKTSILIFYILIQISCNNTEKLINSEEITDFPKFDNVDFSNIFSKQDIELKNKEEIINKISAFYKSKWIAGDLSGGFLVAKGDEILYENYIGFSQENDQNPINKDTPLHLASVSKTMTAMLTLKMIEAGRLKLEQKVNTILPKFPYSDVRVIDLLTQRSGLPKYEYFLEDLKIGREKFLTNQMILDIMIAKKPLQDRPANSHFMYCNTNYMILALIVEKICGLPFPQVIQKSLFEPLGMNNTYVFTEKNLNSYTKSFYRTKKVHPLDYLDLIYGDKNIYSTPRDLLQFSKAMHSEKFLPKKLINQVFLPYSNESKGVNNYGLGFRMKIFDTQNKLTYHNGWWHGSNTVFVHLLKSKVTIIALGNKFGRGYYSAVNLSSLFENFPIELELDENNENKNKNIDSIMLKNNVNETKKSINNQKDSISKLNKNKETESLNND